MTSPDSLAARSGHVTHDLPMLCKCKSPGGCFAFLITRADPANTALRASRFSLPDERPSAWRWQPPRDPEARSMRESPRASQRYRAKPATSHRWTSCCMRHISPFNYAMFLVHVQFNMTWTQAQHRKWKCQTVPLGCGKESSHPRQTR